MNGSYFLDVKQYSDSNNIHVPPWLLPEEWRTTMATRVGMCCREQAQWATSDASVICLQIGGTIITPGLEKKSGRDQMTHSSRWHHCLIPPQCFFPNPQIKLSDHLSHQDEIVNCFLLPLPFCEHTNCPECRNLKYQCVIWDCVFVHLVWVAWPLGVCMCVSVCVFVIQQLSRPWSVSLRCQGRANDTGGRNIKPCWPLTWEDNAASLPVDSEKWPRSVFVELLGGR